MVSATIAPTPTPAFSSEFAMGTKSSVLKYSGVPSAAATGTDSQGLPLVNLDAASGDTKASMPKPIATPTSISGPNERSSCSDDRPARRDSSPQPRQGSTSGPQLDEAQASPSTIGGSSTRTAAPSPSSSVDDPGTPTSAATGTR